MRILFLGDIVGRPGRRAVKEILPSLKEKYHPHLIIANGENAAGGNGITEEASQELYDAGIDILTMGNHVWDRKEIYNFIDHDERIIRPANYPPNTPGRGFTMVPVRNSLVGIVNLAGRVFLPPLDCPFRSIDQILPLLQQETSLILVDFHAEATSEKVAFGWYVDGRVTAVIGTHTHIQTADERILPKGTGYITDVGMTGPRDSVLGVKLEAVLKKFLTLQPVRFEVAGGALQLNALFLEIHPEQNTTQKIERIQVIKEK
ncbi:MAG: TIGR00282 family metallophosphoesterase [Bacillota bacterium]|nr:TIGR00282 family metallophosphoesterase [Bacillota bacterium]